MAAAAPPPAPDPRDQERGGTLRAGRRAARQQRLPASPGEAAGARGAAGTLWAGRLRSRCSRMASHTRAMLSASACPGSLPSPAPSSVSSPGARTQPLRSSAHGAAKQRARAQQARSEQPNARPALCALTRTALHAQRTTKSWPEHCHISSKYKPILAAAAVGARAVCYPRCVVQSLSLLVKARRMLQTSPPASCAPAGSSHTRRRAAGPDLPR